MKAKWTMTEYFFGLAATALLALPISAATVPVKALTAGPQQARQIEGYRWQQAGAVETQNPMISTFANPTIVSRSNGSRSNVAAVNALVSKYEFRDEYWVGARRWFTPLVEYSLKVELYNSTNKIAKRVHVYYDILSWNQDNNESGSFVVADIQPGRNYIFNEPLLNGPIRQDSLNRYEGVRVRINRIDWLDEDGSPKSNDVSIKFGYWGKV